MPPASTAAIAWKNAAGRHPLLTAAAELHLGALVRKWRDWEPTPDAAPSEVRRRGLRARDKMIASNLRLVAYVVSRRDWPPTMAVEDLLQAGAVGLMRAVELFDPERGYKLSTFSYWWILQGINRELDNTCSTIRLPSNVVAAMRGGSRMKLSPEQLDAATPIHAGLRSLDTVLPSHDGTIRTLADTITGSNLEVADLGQAESVSAAWEAMQEADPEGVALLQLHHADGARVRDLAVLMDATTPATSKRLRTVTDRLRALPEVAEALAC